MIAAHPTIDLGGRKIIVDLPHLAFATGIGGWIGWFCHDAWRSAANVENLILIVPASALALLLYGIVAASCFRMVAKNEPARSHPPFAGGHGVKIAGSMALLAAFVVGGPLIGFDVASFAYVLAMLLFLGERRIVMLVLVPLLFCVVVIYGFNTVLATPLPLYFFSGDGG